MARKFKDKKVGEKFKHTSPMQTTDIEKIVLNCGVGQAVGNKQFLDNTEKALMQIAGGQKPVLTQARNSITTFKLREGMLIGLSAKKFDQWGNYNVGINDLSIFPTVPYDLTFKNQGLQITIVFKSNSSCTISSKQLTNLLFQQKNDNFSSADLLTTNLVLITSDNRTSDFFAEKQLIFPLANEEDKIVAFASRKIEVGEASEGKYKYLPSYQYYHKSALLYNYLGAKKSREEEVYLVEGFFDVISLVEKGVENCVAMLGTNLAEEQIKLLTSLQKKLVLFLDGDKAGKEATINALVKLLLREVDCEAIKGNYEGDPDEICRQYDKEAIQDFLKKREKPYLFVLDYYFSK
ncbi:874_t:CDS:2 [Ambispora leptoticha]|uniref:874_t:CDS:1 n=1 Tax=Ambispora leptoticha TaxID=144679 RepID=A0A9N8Z4W1_9GLOM|nr:874_t:CDS:2 [Ambispora leptoticha]